MLEKSAIVFVGSKTPMDYVLAVMTRLSAGDAKEVVLKARGQAITTAVDVAEMTSARLWEFAQEKGLASCFQCKMFPYQSHYDPRNGVYSKQFLDNWKDVMEKDLPLFQ